MTENQKKSAARRRPPGKLPARADIIGALVRALLHYPELGPIVLSWEMIVSPDIPTIATDGRRLFYNPDFLVRLSDEEATGVLVHEAFHVIFLHPAERPLAMSSGKRMELWLIAAEMTTNAETWNLIRSRDALPGSPISPFAESVPAGDGAEDSAGYWYDPEYASLTLGEIYAILDSKNRKGELNPRCFRPRGSSIFCGAVFASDNSAAAREELSARSEEAVRRILARGEYPGGTDRFRRRLGKCGAPWERVLRAFAGQVVSGTSEYRYEKPNHRHPLAGTIICPGLVDDEPPEICVAIDTSGSISEPQLDAFAAGVAKLADLTGDITVYTIDAKVQESRLRIRAASEVIRKIKFRGGGGTDFRPLFKAVSSCALMVVFTDGCAAYPPSPPPYPVFWALTGRHSTPPWGKHAYVFDV